MFPGILTESIKLLSGADRPPGPRVNLRVHSPEGSGADPPGQILPLRPIECHSSAHRSAGVGGAPRPPAGPVPRRSLQVCIFQCGGNFILFSPFFSLGNFEWCWVSEDKNAPTFSIWITHFGREWAESSCFQWRRLGAAPRRLYLTLLI